MMVITRKERVRRAIKFQDPDGFYLPRNVAENGRELKPQVRVANRPIGGAAAGFEKPRQMPTMVRGIKAGFSYPPFNEALTKYVDSVAIRVAEKNLGKAVLKLEKKGARGRVSLFQTRDVDIPAEVSDVINKEVAKIKGVVGSEEGNLFTQINNNLRGIMASGDASRVGIQSLPFMADNPRLALASFRVAFRTLLDPDAITEFVKNFDEQALAKATPTSDRWVSSGLEFSKSSGAGTDIGGLSTIIEQKTGPFGSLIKRTNRLFSDGGNIDRLNMADMLYKQQQEGGIGLLGSATNIKSGASEQEILDAISRIVNRSSGFTDNVIGGDLGRAIFFAPRFFTSQLETIIKAFSDGTIEGQIARRQMTKLFAAGAGITFLINEVRDKETVFDPRDSNFMRIRDVFGADISLFGPWDSLIRGFVRSVPHPTSDGGFTLGKPDNFLRSKLSPVLSLTIDLISGETFLGEESRTPENLIRSVMPFALGDIDEESFTTTAGAVEAATGFLGVKTTPLTFSEELDNLLSNAGIERDDPDYLIKRREWMAQNQDKVPRAKRGEFKERQEIRDDVTSRRKANEQFTINGKQSLVDFRETRSGLLKEQRIRLDAIGDFSSNTNTQQEEWLDSYFNILESSQDEISGDVNSDLFDTALAPWLATNGKEALDFVHEFLGAGLGEVESAYYDDLRVLDEAGFFNINRYRGMQSSLTEAEINQWASHVDSARLANPSLQTQTFARTSKALLGTVISPEELRDVINSRKVRFENPEYTKLKRDFRKELLWFNPRADWNAYTTSQPVQPTASGSRRGTRRGRVRARSIRRSIR
ncbi:hypothetical protein LCGC14_1180720 [marine sediment metagenome]|uniref:Uncharacterized protein n=1 Tax=marine sediment metagenome TaxID=412755 RepID=A0A0F9P551_9ZZZZ